MEGILAKDRPKPERTRPREAVWQPRGKPALRRWPLEISTSVSFKLTDLRELLPQGPEWMTWGAELKGEGGATVFKINHVLKIQDRRQHIHDEQRHGDCKRIQHLYY